MKTAENIYRNYFDSAVCSYSADNIIYYDHDK
jgi:hypothetical protein